MFGFVGTRAWVYPQSIDGRFQRVRRWTFLGLHLILFGLPWLRVGGNPALQLDLPGRRLHAFGAMFTAADTILLLLLMLFLAFSLFFFTSLYGRLWCGYGCPQTVLLDTWVRPIERWIEGEHTTRRRRDAAPLSWDRAWRKAAKWSVFALVAVVVSMAFMSFFAGARELWTGRAGTVEYTLVGIFAVVWFLDFAWFREQFCNYLCPYARFQSALVDDRTLMITYDAARGEPRGGKQAKHDGRCVGCDKCVNVCPQGIDIRNGFQLECIGCAKCIDACTSVMDRLGHETLVQYGSLVELARRQSARESGVPQAPPSTRRPGWRRPRPRVVAYATLLAVLLVVGAGLVRNRLPFEAGVARAPGSLFTMDDDGYVRNTFLVRIANNAPARGEGGLAFQVEVEGLPGAQVIAPRVELRSAESRVVPLVVRMRASDGMDRTFPIRVHVIAPMGERVLDTTFKTGGAEHAQGW
jgi:cytochrome c oxidase accessory protein FixG